MKSKKLQKTLKISAKTSTGPDGYSTILLKVIEPEISTPLALLINQSIHSGTFPNKLKIAKIISIFKKGDNAIFNNYRPISLMPVISKVIEQIMHNQLSAYLENHKLLSGSQYGFRHKHSTEYAAFEVVDRIITHMDINDIPINIHIDLSKAFDTIDHSILIDELQFYGIKGINLTLCRSYLENREPYTQIDDIKLNTLPIKPACLKDLSWDRYYLFCTSMISQGQVIFVTLSCTLMILPYPVL